MLNTDNMDYFKGLDIRLVTKNTAAQIAVRSTATISTFASIFIITYFQGFDLLGAVSKITAFVTFFYLLTDFGLNAMFIKFYFKNAREYTGTLIMLRLLISIFLAAITILVASILPYNATLGTGYSVVEKIGIAIFSLTIITQATSLSLHALLQKELKFHLSVIPSILSGFVLLTVIFLGAKMDNLQIVLLGYVLAQLIYITLLYKKLQSKFHISFQTKEFKVFSAFLLKVSAPLGLILLFNIILAKSDLIILSLLKNNFDVGVYSFSYKIFDFLIIIPTFLSTSMYPILLQKQHTSHFTQAVKKYSLMLLTLSLIVAVTVFISSPLLKYIRGDFSLSVAPLQILTFSLPFFFITSLMQWVMIIRGKLKILAAIYFVTMAVSIGLNFIYIPQFSYFATATVTVFSEGLVFAFMLLYFGIEKTKIFHKTT